MDLGITKCAITRCPNKSKMNQKTFKAQIQEANITYRNQPIPVLHQNEPYTYLGIQLIPSLKWKIQIYATTTKLINQCSQLANCPATIKQKIEIVDTVIRAGIAYSFYVVPYSLPAIIKLDKKIIAIQKKICGLPKCIPNIVTQLPHDMFGIEAFSLKNAYLRCIKEQFQNALNDKGRLGIIYKGLTHFVLAKHGGAENIPRIKYQDCIRSPTTRTLFLIKKVGGAHLQSNIDNFLLKATTLEQIWCQLSTIQLPQINPTQTLKLLHKLLFHKLLLYNIYEIKHITLPNGINLMIQEDFKKNYTKPTKQIKQALDIVEQLFCYPRCNPICQTPCDNHHPPRTLKEEYITLAHNIEPRITETPIQPPCYHIHHNHFLETKYLDLLDMHSPINGKELDMLTLIMKNEAETAIHWARLAAKNDPNTITILTIPDNKRYQNHTPHIGPFQDTHVIAHIPTDTITYEEPTIPIEMNKPQVEPYSIHIQVYITVIIT